MKITNTNKPQPDEKQIVANILTAEAQRNFSRQKAARASAELSSELMKLLGNAKTHPEIEKALPRCQKFFKSLRSEEFALLLESVGSDESVESNGNPVYIALWYHYGAIMHKAIDKCALSYKERMMLLYPLFRLYSDESDTYL